MRVFCPKIGQFSTKISKILEINKNHQNTCYSKNLDHLEHFWPKKWLFFYNFQFLGILPKIAASGISATVKLEKNQILKNCFQQIVDNTLRYIFVHFLVNWNISHGVITFFVKLFFFKIFADFCRVSKKMTVFRPKIGQFSTKIYKISEINKNHLNTPNCQILDHLKHF